MKIENKKKILILGILFFLPVTFLLFLYPSTHHYNPLDVVRTDVKDIQLNTIEGDSAQLNGHITILSFLGNKPLEQSTVALNLKELIYDKFKGFKRFQIITITHKDAVEEANQLKIELQKYETFNYWKFALASQAEIKTLYASLATDQLLNKNLASNHVFIIDKEHNQRGRLDDRTDDDIENRKSPYPLYTYNCISVDELKNKLSDDLRILFTEYRQKRKGKFNSSSRRSKDIKPNER